MAQSYTLYELNEYIRRVIALNFPESVWITCEISQAKNSRGNIYLDLVQQDEEDNVVAQSSAAIWYKSYLFLKSKLGELLPSLLTPGTQIRVKVMVEYSEKYGMKLIVEDIDPAFTLGKLEMARQKILERLHHEGVSELNKALPLPTVIQRIAVISAENAAGYIDFKTHLETNSYGYHFAITLFPAALQGSKTETEVCDALSRISKDKKSFDLIAIIRGGGSKLDLAGFDNFNIGHKVATSPIPVFTGIGHEIDQSIADLMAHTAMKTPTAVADFILEHNVNFEGEIMDMMHSVERIAHRELKMHQLSIENVFILLQSLPAEAIRNQTIFLSQLQQQLMQQVDHRMHRQLIMHESFDQILHVSDPIHTLNKGYTIVNQGGKIVAKKREFTEGDLTIQFADGVIEINNTPKIA